MTPLLLLPAGLAALAALLLPLAVHLARRTEQRPVDFAALRWLRPKARPQRRPRFQERVLLAARLLLLALLALWLARPAVEGAVDRRAWVAVVPGVDPAAARGSAARGARGVWLAPGFPALDGPAPAGPVPVASLVRQLDADAPPGAGLTVFVPPVIEGADAERPRVSRAVAWRVAAGRMAAPAAPTPSDDAPRLAVRYAAGVPGLAYVGAVAAALARAGERADVAPVTAPLPRAGALVWWAAGPLPAEVLALARNRPVLVPSAAVVPPGPGAVAWRDPAGARLAERAGGVIRFVRPLVPAQVPYLLDPGFPDGVRALVSPPTRAPARAAARDVAPVAGAAGPEARAATTDLRPWLAPLIAAVLLAERWLATRRARAPAP